MSWPRRSGLFTKFKGPCSSSVDGRLGAYKATALVNLRVSDIYAASWLSRTLETMTFIAGLRPNRPRRPRVLESRQGLCNADSY
jgi:hypothetical protein